MRVLRSRYTSCGGARKVSCSSSSKSPRSPVWQQFISNGRRLVCLRMLSTPFLGVISSPKVSTICLQEEVILTIRSLGLFAVPTRIILGVAPINAILNYILGE